MTTPTLTFSQRLQQLWQQHPNQPAVHLLHNRQPDRAITYNDLLLGACGYAQKLSDQDIQPGEVVIIILQHGDSLLFAFWGSVLHGAIPSIMPFLTEKLSPDQYRRSLAALFEVTAPAAVLTYAEFVPEVQHALAVSKAAPGAVRAILVAEEIPPLGQVDFSLLKGLTRKPEDIVLLQHSSGTTGLQKGVALSHKSVFNQIKSYTRAIRLSTGDVVVSWLPLYHDMGLIAGFILPILSAVPLVLLSPFDWVRAPYRLLQAVSQYKGTLSWLPNFAYNFSAQKIRDRDLEGVDLSSWRAVINCSEPMYLKSHQAFQQRFQAYGLPTGALATCYAMAENVFAVSQGGIAAPVTVDVISQRAFIQERRAQPPYEGELSLSMLSAGQPIENTRLHILDENRRELPERHIGEIAILSDCMLSEYYHRLDATAQAFHNGWYLTGDLGYLANNEIYITGRKKDLIIVGGKNVYPQDLESLASEVQGVHPGRVAAFGVPNEETGTEDVVIIAELDQSAQHAGMTPEAIGNAIRQRVTQGSDISLRLIKVVEHGWLLKTSSGKVARSANREKYLAGL